MEIYNLAKYINIFSGCVINIINYKDINIPSTLSTPIWTTRYHFAYYCQFFEAMSDRPKLRYKIYPIDHLSNLTFPFCEPAFDEYNANKIPLRRNVHQQRGWKCLTRFYIFPPPGDLAGVIPPDIYEEQFSSGYRFRRYYRTGYHILLQRPGGTINTWTTEMITLLDENTGLNMLLVFVNDNLITNFQFCCRYCHGCYQVCQDVGIDELEEIGIGQVAHKFNVISDKTPWRILSYTSFKYRNIPFSEIMKDNVNIDGILLNLLLGSNGSTEFRLHDWRHYVQNELHTAHNGTLLLNQCAIPTIKLPTINMVAESWVELVTNIRPYSFLSCSKRRKPQTSLEHLVHVFPLILWAFVIGTSVFLGIFILFTSKAKVSKFEILSTGYNILLEQGSSIAGNSSREPYIYFVCGPWILMSVIITTLIRGDNVQNTINPLRVLPYTNFSQLIENGFTFVDTIITYKDGEGFELRSIGWHAAHTRARSSIETLHTLISDQIYKRFYNFGVHYNHMRIRAETNIWWLYPDQIVNNSSRFSCAAEKMAYLGWFDKLEEAKALLEKYRPGPEYSIGLEPIGLVPMGWRVENVVDPRIPIRMRTLHHSGIVKMWIWYKGMAEELRKRDRAKNTGPEALILLGNISEIFIMFFQVAVCTTLVFLVETMYFKISIAKLQKFCILRIMRFKNILGKLFVSGIARLKALNLIACKEKCRHRLKRRVLIMQKQSLAYN
ncbi:hypothetical protein Fcan01_25448 [Folsomia candida]|uniref:Uncharacterized protein n=1 Tax=Folsomia candida TaxID=158441 RepID=A0A226D4N3_FOLCA|nr:hypothetical protein Fcan01_25448 [Folsomia candida]